MTPEGSGGGDGGATRGSYAWLDHTGDAGIDAEAPDLPSLFAACARALFEILAGEEPGIREEGAVEITLESRGRDLLLLEWLRELHLLHERDGWLFAGFHVKVDELAGPCFRLSGHASGERLDPRRHHIETEIKAVTYHQLSVRQTADGTWRARVIFDI